MSYIDRCQPLHPEPSPGMPPRPIECGCGAVELRCGCRQVAEDMGWQKIDRLWLCPTCGGRQAMFLSFWDPRKWSEPNGPIEL